MSQIINPPISCYSKDKRGVYLAVNEAFLECSLVPSAETVLGQSDQDLPWGIVADEMMENDQKTVKSGLMHTYFEHALYQGKPQLFRSFKSPLIGRNGKILGVHGMSVPVSERCLIYLPRQQEACLKHLALGLSHKQIARALGIAEKTVEHYLEAVKAKLNCNSRSDLVIHAIERGLVSPV